MTTTNYTLNSMEQKNQMGERQLETISQHLTDSNFQNELQEAIEFHKATKHFHSIMKGWDTLKTKIKKIAIRITSR